MKSIFVLLKAALQGGFFLAFLCLSAKATAQTYTVSGFVKDSLNGEALIGAAVYDGLSHKGASANGYGFFSLKTATPEARLRVSYAGYAPAFLDLKLSGDTSVIIRLSSSLLLKEVEVLGSSFEEDQMQGKTQMGPERLNSIPFIGGERDLLRALTTLPGVAASGEGSTAINVRGGSSDQNLFLLDGAPIYNTGHLFGLFSVFNPDAIKKADFYKGYFPARFGGRLSSVVDVAFREGNTNRWGGKVEVGLINSKAMLEGYFGKKRKTSVLIAARSTYLDLINIGKEKAVLKQGTKNETRNRVLLGYTFYDINFKIAHEFSPKSKFFLSFYQGKDSFRALQNMNNTYIGDNGFGLLNSILSAKYYTVLGKGVFLQAGGSLSANLSTDKEREDYYSRYDITPYPNYPYYTEFRYKLKTRASTTSANRIADYNFYALAEFPLGKRNTITAGADYVRHFYRPASYTWENLEKTDSLGFVERGAIAEKNQQADEPSVHTEIETRFSDKLSLKSGLRLSAFMPGDTVFRALEPRFSLSYKSKIGLFQASATRMRQYSHALGRIDQMQDVMIWVPSTKKIPPQNVLQYSVGWFRTMEKYGLDISVEAYHKKFENLSNYRFFYTDKFLYLNWEKATLGGGQGKAYGLELYAQKHAKRFDATLSYTLSWNYRRFDGLNKNLWYPSLYDRRNNLTLTGALDLGKKRKLSALWTYSTGRRINFPFAAAPYTPYSGYDYQLYLGMNSGKLPDYHRLDLSYTRESKRLLWGRPVEMGLHVYNAYARRNAYYIYVETKSTRDLQGNLSYEESKVKSKSLIPIIPTVSFSYKF